MKYPSEGADGSLEGDGNNVGHSGRENAFVELAGLEGKLIVEEEIQRQCSELGNDPRQGGTEGKEGQIGVSPQI